MYQHLINKAFRLLVIIAALSIGAFMSGCASHHGAAHIVSEPAGATVFNLRDKTELGVTPLIVHFIEDNDERQNIALRFEKEGYYNKTAAFWLKFQHPDKKSAVAAADRWETSMRKISELSAEE